MTKLSPPVAVNSGFTWSTQTVEVRRSVTPPPGRSARGRPGRCREHPKCPPHEQLVMSAFTGLPVERAGDRSRETGGPRGESHDEDGSDRDDGEGGADGVPGGGHSRALSPAAAAPPEAVRDLWRRRPDGRPFRAFAQETGLGDDHRRALPTQTRGLPGLLAAPLS